MEKIKSIFLNKMFFTFLAIGIANTVTAQLLYMIFILVSINAGMASILGDIISVIVSYFLNIKFTYHVKHNWNLFINFPISYIPGWIINYFIVLISVYLGITEIFAKIISLPITIPLNFILMNIIVKSKGEERKAY